jgi:hypothetical protein
MISIKNSERRSGIICTIVETYEAIASINIEPDPNKTGFFVGEKLTAYSKEDKK